LISSSDRTQPPQLSGALADFMEAVEGDRSILLAIAAKPVISLARGKSIPISGLKQSLL